MAVATGLILILCLLDYVTSQQLIISQPQNFSVNPLGPVSLPCTVTNSDGTKPDTSTLSRVTWTKKQGNDNAVVVGIAGRKQGVFANNDNNRIVLESADVNNTLAMSLEINGATLSDSGNYTCQIDMSTQVNYIVYVYDDVTPSVKLNTPDTYYADKPGFVECLVSGGLPPPQVTLTVGEPPRTLPNVKTDLNITLSGAPGLKLFNLSTRAYVDPLFLTVYDAYTDISCAIEGSKLPPKASMVTLLAKPEFINSSCARQYFPDKNKPPATISCQVEGVPTPTARWVALKTGQEINSGEGRIGFMESTQLPAIPQEKDKLLTLSLEIFDLMTDDSGFQDYMINATNSQGWATFTISVLPGVSTSERQVASVMGVVLVSLSASVLAYL